MTVVSKVRQTTNQRYDLKTTVACTQVISSVGGHLLRYPLPLPLAPSLRHVHSSLGVDVGPDRLLHAASPVAVDLDGVVTLRMEEEGLGARQPVSCYTTIKWVVTVMWRRIIASLSLGLQWRNTTASWPGWTMTGSGHMSNISIR